MWCFLAAWKKVLTEHPTGEQPKAAIISVNDGQTANALFFDRVHCLTNRRMVVQGDDLRVHDIAHRGRDVAQELRSRNSKLMQYEVDPFVRVAGSSRDDVGEAQLALQFGVGDCRTD